MECQRADPTEIVTPPRFSRFLAGACFPLTTWTRPRDVGHGVGMLPFILILSYARYTVDPRITCPPGRSPPPSLLSQSTLLPVDSPSALDGRSVDRTATQVPYTGRALSVGRW